MTTLDRKLALEALADYVHGSTLQLDHGNESAAPGATLVGFAAFESHADASCDSIVGAWSVEHVDDIVAALHQWRRVLREGGHLAVVLRDAASAWGDAPHCYTPDAWQNLLRTIGGFELVRLAELDDGNGWLVVAQRHALLDLRNILGCQGAALSDAAQRSPEHRAELCFQFGTILLRAGVITPAIHCFHALLEQDPDNGEGLFGLGMCHALQQQWQDAHGWLERAVAVDPNNSEAKRWLGLAQLELDANRTDVGPQSLRSPESPTT